MTELLTNDNFEKFRSLIYDSSGIHFSDSNRPVLESRLRECLRVAQLETVDDYYTLIKGNADELKTFLDSITTNLTRFFRNQPHFDSMEHYVFPELVQYKRSQGLEKKIKVWSAGCSTGEEPYTLAMLFKEKLPSDFDFNITASDLSLKSLMTANQGVYPQARIQGIPEDYLSKYFSKNGDNYQVKDEIKSHIKFDYHNLKFDSNLRDIDIVLCRNVLIYFDEPAQKNVIERFWTSMTNHAYLYIGHSESLFGMETSFKFLKTEWAVFYTKILN